MANKLKTQSSKLKANKKPRAYFLIPLYAFLSILVLYNIYSSQTISPLYDQLINERYEGTTGFLKKIINQSFFPYFLTINKNIYGSQIENDVFVEKNQKKQQVKNLEAILQKNPLARDILIALSSLYNELGDKTKAEEYLKKAKEVDPEVR